MRTRLFNNQDPSIEPRIVFPSPIYMDVLDSYFLNAGDRELVSKIYEFAQEQGCDLKFVDNLAWELGGYRRRDNGKDQASFNRGYQFDTQGHEVFYDFTQTDAATARRILQGDGIKTTQVDQGFLRHTLNKDYGSMYHPDFDFLEEVVNRFSMQAVDLPPLGSKFDRYLPLEKNFIRTLSKNIRLKKPVTTDVPDDVLIRNKKGLTLKTPPTETFRDIIYRTFPSAFNKYLIPTLFDMLARLRR